MTKLRILLVEDSVGPTISKGLESLGHQVDLAEDAEKGWPMLKRGDYDMLLVDWMLPKTSGVELVKQVRSEKRLRDIPILMISAKASREDIVAAVDFGIDSYLAKPFTVAQISEKLETVWEKRGAVRQLTVDLRQTLDNQLRLEEDPHRPLVIFGEKYNSVGEMSLEANRGAARFLCNAAQAIDQINVQYPALNLGYSIGTSTSQIVDGLKATAVRDRVRTVVISSDCPGSPVLFARLMRGKLGSYIPIMVSCESVHSLSAQHLAGLEKFSIPILERPEHGPDQIKEVLEVQVAPETGAESGEAES